MIEGIPLPLVDLTPWGLLALTFLLIITGKLIPLGTHKDVIAQRDHWQAIATTALNTGAKNADIIDTQAEALRLQVEGSEFSRKVMEAIQEASAKNAAEEPR